VSYRQVWVELEQAIEKNDAKTIAFSGFLRVSNSKLPVVIRLFFSYNQFIRINTDTMQAQ
jgi:hypothetical protein